MDFLNAGCILNAMDWREDDFVWRDIDEATANSDSDDNDDDIFYGNSNEISEDKIGKLFNSEYDDQEFEGF